MKKKKKKKQRGEVNGADDVEVGLKCGNPKRLRREEVDKIY